MADVAPIAPVPAAGSPRANGVPRGAVQTPVPAPVVPVSAEAVPTPEALKAERAKLVDERRALEVKMVRQQRKYADEAKAKEKSWGEKLSKLSEFEKRDAQAKLNPAAYLESLYGEKWYDRVVEARISGAPTADVVASEIAKVRDEMEQKFTARDEARNKAELESQQRAEASARRQLHAEGVNFWKANGKEFPVLEGLGNEAQVSAILAQRIEAKYNATIRKDESGEVLVDGSILTMKQAAEELESEVLAIAEKAAQHEKYAERLKLPAPRAPAALGGPTLQQQQQRRTLSNSLTASTSGRTPAVSDAERRERAITAFNALRNKPTP